jgi:hypothetical protein
MIIQLQIRYLVFIPYLIFVGMLDGNILAESIVIGLALAIYDYLFDNGG